MELLANSVFPNIWKCFNDHEWLCERAILVPKNNSVTAINLQIQQHFPEKLHLTSRLIQLQMWTRQFVPYRIFEFSRTSWNATTQLGVESWFADYAPEEPRCIKIVCETSNASCYQSNDSDRLCKVWGYSHTTNIYDSYRYAIRVRASSVSSKTYLQDVHQ